MSAFAIKKVNMPTASFAGERQYSKFSRPLKVIRSRIRKGLIGNFDSGLRIREVEITVFGQKSNEAAVANISSSDPEAQELSAALLAFDLIEDKDEVVYQIFKLLDNHLSQGRKALLRDYFDHYRSMSTELSTEATIAILSITVSFKREIHTRDLFLSETRRHLLRFHEVDEVENLLSGL